MKTSRWFIFWIFVLNEGFPRDFQDSVDSEQVILTQGWRLRTSQDKLIGKEFQSSMRPVKLFWHRW